MTQTKAGANDIYLPPYPTISEGNDAFPEGVYQARARKRNEGKKDHYKLVLDHELRGARLITNMINKGKAVYACRVSSPNAAFCDLQCSAEPSQTVTWKPENLAQSPFFTPMIVCTEEHRLVLNHANHDTHPDLDDVPVIIPKGARLAWYSVMRMKNPGMYGLLELRRDDNLKPGQFRVHISSDGDFKFIVYCHPELLRFVKSPGEKQDRRRDILTHMVTACFAKLQRDYRKDEGEDSEGGWNYRELDELSKELKQKGYCDWQDDDFCPELAATTLHPHTVPEQDRDDE
ncbi:MAG: hypothetical protein M2R45_00093 [Verrucomicrobia subdivision 3 bacterium]|nr:hypothetical protein [Limisphaerales bacterium]MCS1412448.1 hypothetical protein [Limisphaerales bacterium]